MDWKEAIDCVINNNKDVTPVDCCICENGFDIGVVKKYNPNDFFSVKYDPKDPFVIVTSSFFVKENKAITRLTRSMFNSNDTITGKIIKYIPYEEVDEYCESI